MRLSSRSDRSFHGYAATKRQQRQELARIEPGRGLIRAVAEQLIFARGRQRYFAEVESANLDPQSRMRLEALFSSYDASVIAAEQALQEANGLGFAALMRQLTPGAFPRDA